MHHVQQSQVAPRWLWGCSINEPTHLPRSESRRTGPNDATKPNVFITAPYTVQFTATNNQLST